jgi:hypothetical protein
LVLGMKNLPFSSNRDLERGKPVWVSLREQF